MELSGYIKDKSTGAAIPYASVAIVTPNGQSTGIGTTADNAGRFQLSNQAADYPNYLQITSIGYYPAKVQLYQDFYIDYSDVFLLDRKTTELPPVVVNSSKTSLAWLLIPAAILLANKDNKKKVSGAKGNATIITIALAGGVILSWSLIQKLLCKIGIFDCTPGEGNAGSPWNPQYYEAAADQQEKVLLAFSGASFVQKADTIYNAFSLLNDDFSAIMGVFQSLQSKIKVSYLSKIFTQEYNVSLLSFLKDGGGILPWDGLSSDHLNQIDKYVNSLPIH